MSNKNKKNKKSKNTNNYLYGFIDTPLGIALELICFFGFFVCIGLLVRQIDVEKNQKPKQVEINKIK
jgi:hypothetical protein